MNKANHSKWVASIAATPKKKRVVEIFVATKLILDPILKVGKYPLSHTRDIFTMNCALAGG